MKTSWRLTGIILVAVMVVGWSFVFARSYNPFEEHSKVLSQSEALPKHNISALGTIAPRGRIRRLAASSSFARVGALFVEEGDWVVEGQRLAYADDHKLKALELEQAKANVEIAQSKLQQFLAGADPHEVKAIEASLAASIETREQRKREWDRVQVLARNKTLSQEEIENAKLRWSVATWTVREMEAKQMQKCVLREEDIRVLRAELQASIQRMETAQQHLAMAEIVSPVDGKVLRILIREGERCGDAGILEIGDTKQMQVIAEVYEADAMHVRLGAKATVRLKSSGKALSGRVSHVRPMVGRKTVLDNDPVSDADARVVEVIVDLCKEESAVVQSLTNASATVILHLGEP